MFDLAGKHFDKPLGMAEAAAAHLAKAKHTRPLRRPAPTEPSKDRPDGNAVGIPDLKEATAFLAET
jgi:hypothetical protein